MFIGHIAVALGAKKFAPRTSLGTLMFSAQFLDLLWPLFLLWGVEHVRIDPGNTAVTPLDFYDYPLTHSLLTAMAWAVLVAGTHYLTLREARTAVVLYLVVLSHWVLDFITHRPDLPVIPGMDTLVGLGLWNSVGGTIAVELAMFLAGTALYVQTTVPRIMMGRLGLWLLLSFLLVTWVINIFGPPPADERLVAFAGLGLWLLVLAGFGVDRARELRNDSEDS